VELITIFTGYCEHREAEQEQNFRSGHKRPSDAARLVNSRKTIGKERSRGEGREGANVPLSRLHAESKKGVGVILREF